MQSLADCLRSIRSDISDQDLVLYTLQGLESKFESFVTVFSIHQTTTSMIELQSLLLTHEARIKANFKSSTFFLAHLTSSQSDNSTPVTLYTTGPNTNPSFKNNSSQTPSRSQGYKGEEEIETEEEVNTNQISVTQHVISASNGVTP
jgi:gag-polypeptide of LTR copia-type